MRKPNLDKRGIEKLKSVSESLLATLKARLAEIADWQATQSNRDAVRVAIHNFLYDDTTGLPVELYDESEVEATTEAVYEHVWPAYPTPFSDVRPVEPASVSSLLAPWGAAPVAWGGLSVRPHRSDLARVGTSAR